MSLSVVLPIVLSVLLSGVFTHRLLLAWFLLCVDIVGILVVITYVVGVVTDYIDCVYIAGSVVGCCVVGVAVMHGVGVASVHVVVGGVECVASVGYDAYVCTVIVAVGVCVVGGVAM